MERRLQVDRRTGERRGPPPQRGETASVRITVRLTPAERDDLERVKHDNQAPDLASVIRDAVNAYVADYRDDDPVFLTRQP